MTAFALRPTTLALSILATMAVSAASAATISHSAPRPPAPTETSTVGSTSPASSLPYACDKTELNTRLEKKTCL